MTPCTRRRERAGANLSPGAAIDAHFEQTASKPSSNANLCQKSGARRGEILRAARLSIIFDIVSGRVALECMVRLCAWDRL